MSKAVLVVDMPEQFCEKCQLCYEKSSLDGYMCAAFGKEIPDGEIPDWCPLNPLPEKQNNDNLMDEYMDGYDFGWNACIDAIVGCARSE